MNDSQRPHRYTSLVPRSSLALLGPVRISLEASWDEIIFSYFLVCTDLEVRIPLAVLLLQISLQEIMLFSVYFHLFLQTMGTVFPHFPRGKLGTERLALFKVRGTVEQQKESQAEVSECVNATANCFTITAWGLTEVKLLCGVLLVISHISKDLAC